jgi:hypothetical protein
LGQYLLPGRVDKANTPGNLLIGNSCSGHSIPEQSENNRILFHHQE